MMRNRMQELQYQLSDLTNRLRQATDAHNAAKQTFSRFEGSSGSPLWERLRNEVDTTLTHERVLTALWHRLQADIIDQKVINKESE